MEVGGREGGTVDIEKSRCGKERRGEGGVADRWSGAGKLLLYAAKPAYDWFQLLSDFGNGVLVCLRWSY